MAAECRAHRSVQVLNADSHFAHVGKSHYAHVGHKGVVNQPHKRTSSKQAKEHAQPPAHVQPVQPARVPHLQQPPAALASPQAAAVQPVASSASAPASGQLPFIGQPGQTAADVQLMGSVLASMQAGGSLPGESLQLLLPALAQSVGPAAALAVLAQQQPASMEIPSTQAAAGQGAPATSTVPAAASGPALSTEQPGTAPPPSGSAPCMLGGLALGQPVSGQQTIAAGRSSGPDPAGTPKARGPVDSIEEWS